MSASCAKSPQGRRLVKKSVPDGSSDFQRALDHFLSSSESDDSGEYNEESIAPSEIKDKSKGSSRYKFIAATEKGRVGLLELADGLDSNVYDDEFENCEVNTDSYNTRDHSPRISLSQPDSGKISPRKHDYNNNTSESICTCGRDRETVTITFEDFDLTHNSPRQAWGFSGKDILVSPRDNSDSDLEENPNFIHKRGSGPIKLPSITAHLHPQSVSLSSTGMGINCSANIEDAKEFSSVLTERTGHRKQSKMGGIVTKGSNSTDKPSNSVESLSSEHCSCEHHEDGKKISSNNNKTNAISSSPKSSSTKDGSSKTTKRSSSLPDRGSSKTTSSTPQRLLTSRNRSPNGYLRSSSSTDAGGDMRARSHSWSNGRSISQTRQGPIRPITKNSSLYPRTLALGPNGLRSPHASHQHGGAGVKKSLRSSPNQHDHKVGNISPSAVAHSPGCPLFASSELSSDTKKKVTVTGANTVDSPDGSNEADLSPMQRPRAASESHTTRQIRPHQHLLDLPRPRSNTMSEGSTRALSPSSDLDHGVHVHWADEEQGLSLSTSVLLTSIRPRSYSHGAVDGRPHRPILKKVAGL